MEAHTDVAVALARSRRLKRLQGQGSFDPILAQRQSARGTYLQVYIAAAPSNNVELGVGVSKTVAKRASARNYIRRVIREEVRLNLSALPAVRLVVLVRRAFDRQSRRVVAAELLQLLQRLNLCVARCAS